jgi:lipoate-protein ligase A
MPATAENVWRLLESSAATGAENMALDQAIVEAVSRGDSLPTLRLYAWEPPCLSLGHAQSLDDVDLERLEALSWGLVRRPTGGRAILHTDELTYSVAAPASHPDLAGTVLGSYRTISSGLIAGLARLGLEAEVQPEVRLSEKERANPICFEVPSSYEITVRGRKLVGSAQVRRKGGVLQHGSLPLTGDIRRICQVLRFDSDAAREAAARGLARRAATLEELLGRSIPWEEAARAMAAGFAEALGWKLLRGAPTETERERAAQLCAERFQAPAERGTQSHRREPRGHGGH